MRRDLRRCRRRWRSRGRVALDLKHDTTHLDEALAVESLGWKRTAGTAIVSAPQTARPYLSLSFNLLGWGSGSLLILYGRARRVAVREYGLRMIMCSRQRTMITSEGRAHAQGTARTRRLNDKLRPSESRGGTL